MYIYIYIYTYIRYIYIAETACWLERQKRKAGDVRRRG